MTEVPKIVHHRLRAQAESVPAHPDADLLAAFAEQALSASERESVLGHLALCGDCREVVALALPALDAVVAPGVTEAAAVRATVSRTESPKPRKLIFSWQNLAWPNLRWAALAAGIAVAASVLVLHPGKQNVAKSPSAAPQVSTSVPPASPAPVAESPANQPATLARNDAPKLKSELQSSKPSAGKAPAPAVGAGSGMMLADARTTKKKDEGTRDNRPAAPAAADRALNTPVTHTTSEADEASGASAAAAPAPAAEASSMARNEDTLMARNEAPASETRVMKAKPAPLAVEANTIETKERQKTQAATVGGLPAKQSGNVAYAAKMASPAAQMPVRKLNATWAIVAGALQKSIDNGRTWQSAVHADHPLLCYATNDQEVWTGGQAGTIFHSSDGGATWAQVQPSVKSRTLTSDVTHIELHGAGQIALSTANGETWSSADDGKVWDKK
jgi:hypothetical protein